MILGFEPIHLQPLLSALRQQVDLAVLPAGQDPFASEAGRAAITEAVLSVRAYVEDNCDREGEIRRALAWLLNQPDGVLADLHASSRLPYPTPEVGSMRRYCTALWTEVFCNWQVEDAYPEEDLEVTGLQD